MQQRATVGDASLGDVTRALGVDGKRRLGLVLSLIHPRVGGRIDHRIRTKISEGGGHAAAIADIKLRRWGRMNRHRRRRERLDGSADLAAAAGEKNALKQESALQVVAQAGVARIAGRQDRIRNRPFDGQFGIVPNHPRLILGMMEVRAFV